jgi:hypothetical protein
VAIFSPGKSSSPHLQASKFPPGFSGNRTTHIGETSTALLSLISDDQKFVIVTNIEIQRYLFDRNKIIKLVFAGWQAVSRVLPHIDE